MSLYALTAQAIKGIAREMWGRKVDQPDGSRVDTGVDDFAQELIARLQSIAPIELPSPLELIAPANGPAIRIFTSGDGPHIEIINITNNITENVITNIINEDGEPTPGFSGSVQVLTNVSGNVSTVGCVTTLSLTPTYATLTFSNGILTGSS